MADENDGEKGEAFDPNDWFASQFGQDAPKPATPPVQPPAAPAAPPLTPAESAVPPPAPVEPASAAPVDPAPSTAPLGKFAWELDEPLPPAVAPAAPVMPTAPPAAPVPPAAPTPPPLTEPPAALPAPSLPPFVQPGSAPAAASINPLDQPTQAMDADQFGRDLAEFEPPPVDSSLQGATAVMGAHELGTPEPESEGLAHSPLDDLFGDTQFRDYEGEPLITVPSVRQAAPLVDAGTPPPPGGGIPRSQKTLMWIAGALVGILALVALFLVGTRIANSFGPAPAISADPTPSVSAPVALPVGTPIVPLTPGTYRWSELQGGECLEPYESPWQDEYTVVDCTQPHAAQLVARGLFVEVAGQAYPGFEELGSRINLLCSAPTVIDYAVAGTINDVQVAASFAADVDEWDAGNHGYACFVSRAGGEPLTASVGVPQVVAAAPTPTPTPAP